MPCRGMWKMLSARTGAGGQFDSSKHLGSKAIHLSAPSQINEPTREYTVTENVIPVACCSHHTVQLAGLPTRLPPYRAAPLLLPTTANSSFLVLVALAAHLAIVLYAQGVGVVRYSLQESVGHLFVVANQANELPLERFLQTGGYGSEEVLETVSTVAYVPATIRVRRQTIFV
ncbi:hypothetical protein J6590_005610 [Homalodisca vitripennis]|nr:hypothetical protein J6590_005610 [Homalodisca vitripennis]